MPCTCESAQAANRKKPIRWSAKRNLLSPAGRRRGDFPPGPESVRMHVPYKSVLGFVALGAAAFTVIHWRSADQPASAPAAAPRSRLSPRRCSSTTSRSCFLALEPLRR